MREENLCIVRRGERVEVIARQPAQVAATEDEFAGVDVVQPVLLNRPV